MGSSSSGDTLAVLPLAEEYEKIMVVEPAVADSITGSEFNKYIFRTGTKFFTRCVQELQRLLKKV